MESLSTHGEVNWIPTGRSPSKVTLSMKCHIHPLLRGLHIVSQDNAHHESFTPRGTGPVVAVVFRKHPISRVSGDPRFVVYGFELLVRVLIVLVLDDANTRRFKIIKTHTTHTKHNPFLLTMTLLGPTVFSTVLENATSLPGRKS